MTIRELERTKADAVTSDDFATNFIETVSTFRQYGPLRALAEAVQDGRDWIEKPAQFSQWRPQIGVSGKASVQCYIIISAKR